MTEHLTQSISLGKSILLTALIIRMAHSGKHRYNNRYKFSVLPPEELCCTLDPLMNIIVLFPHQQVF